MASTNPAPETEESTPVRPGAAKDRECPYCHEFFTSSSLGRHLDQFIKEKPKAPDGKHNVDEIRRLRGGVTRRQARNSSARRAPERQDSTPNEPTPPAAKKLRLNGPDSGFWALNRPNWLTTGVISEASPVIPAEVPLTGTAKVNFEEEQRQFIAERNEGRAAKLALTELVDSIKASLARASTPSPFSFDFLAQSFPSLVLHLLPSQPTINSPQVIPNSYCCPIDPPDETHMSHLRTIVSKRLEEFRKELQARRNRDVSEDTTARSPTRSPEPVASEQELGSYAEHLETAYDSWKAMSSAEKTKLWHLSALRAFAQEQEAHQETRKRLEKGEQLLAHEAAQVKRLSSIQQPREFLMNPPSATPLPPKAAESVAAQLMGQDAQGSLDVEALIAKWKPGVQHNRRYQRAFLSVFEAAATIVAAAEVENVPRPETDAGSPNGVAADGEGGRANGEQSDNIPQRGRRGDSLDAPGEEDDDPSSSSRRGVESTVLDPSLRKSGDDNLLAKAAGLVGGVDTPSGSVRKRARR